MAGATRYLLNRDGRFFARLVVPKELRKVIGKTELRAPLGPDRRTAMKHLPGAVAVLQDQIARAERQTVQPGPAPMRYPLAPDQLAANHYARRLALDEHLRSDWRYAGTGFLDEQVVAELRDAVAGKLSDSRLDHLIGDQVERYRALGNLDAHPGSDEWRNIARALCVAELEALARVAERDDGDFTGKPDHPMLAKATEQEDTPSPVSIKRLWVEYVQSRKLVGYMADDGRRQMLAVESLMAHLGHDDAARVTRKDVSAWLDHVVTERSPSTVSKVYLPTIRSLFRWAQGKDRIASDPTTGLRVATPRKVYGRERGYTTPEATTVLTACMTYQPKTGPKGKVLEGAKITAAKKWVPLICAFTGARVAEITQVRREDIRQEAGRWVIRITPEAGSVKTGQWRDVPLHPQIIALGFEDYFKSIPAGPIFHTATDPAKFTYQSKKVANRIGEWLQSEELVPSGVQPLHGWRHRFKTQARELGLSDRIADAIQGYAARTAGDNYGDVSLTAKAKVIDALPGYDLS